VTKDLMNFAQTQINVFASGCQDLQMSDCWLFLILMLENAISYFHQCCDFQKFTTPPTNQPTNQPNNPAQPNIQLGLPLSIPYCLEPVVCFWSSLHNCDWN